MTTDGSKAATHCEAKLLLIVKQSCDALWNKAATHCEAKLRRVVQQSRDALGSKALMHCEAFTEALSWAIHQLRKGRLQFATLWKIDEATVEGKKIRFSSLGKKWEISHGACFWCTISPNLFITHVAMKLSTKSFHDLPTHCNARQAFLFSVYNWSGMQGKTLFFSSRSTKSRRTE